MGGTLRPEAVLLIHRGDRSRAPACRPVRGRLHAAPMTPSRTTIAGIPIPDSTIAREATELVQDVAPRLLFDHSRRVFLFGSLQGEQLGLDYDPELFYVGSMFHDLGLV